jgi:hypothetical protein
VTWTAFALAVTAAAVGCSGGALPEPTPTAAVADGRLEVLASGTYRNTESPAPIEVALGGKPYSQFELRCVPQARLMDPKGLVGPFEICPNLLFNAEVTPAGRVRLRARTVSLPDGDPNYYAIIAFKDEDKKDVGFTRATFRFKTRAFLAEPSGFIIIGTNQDGPDFLSGRREGEVARGTHELVAHDTHVQYSIYDTIESFRIQPGDNCGVSVTTTVATTATFKQSDHDPLEYRVVAKQPDENGGLKPPLHAKAFVLELRVGYQNAVKHAPERAPCHVTLFTSSGAK